MILDCPREGFVEAEDQEPDCTRMELLLGSLDDPCNPSHGLSHDQFKGSIDGMKTDNLSRRSGLPLHSCCANSSDKVQHTEFPSVSPDRPPGLGGGSLA
jgi:hypothetical protein